MKAEGRRLKGLIFRASSFELRASSRGDTLIEVIFAFAILSALIGLAYTGVINARKSALSGQERTQAAEIAQYQAEALNMYRKSMFWNLTAGDPSFLDGGPLSGTEKINDLITPTQVPFCMLTQAPGGGGGITQWRIETDLTTCDSKFLPGLIAPVGEHKVVVRANYIGELDSVAGPTVSAARTDAVRFTITVNWLNAFNQADSVTNVIIMTRSQ